MLQRKRDDSQLLRRSLMVASFAAASLLLAVQWQGRSNSLPADDPIRADFLRPRSRTAGSSQAERSPQTALQTRLLVDLSDRTVSLYRRSKLVADYPIAIGQKGWETPTGSFTIEEMHTDPEWEHPITGEIIPPGSDNPLGSRWIGFWTDGVNQIGFHGTNQAEQIGLAVSHGCLRMHNSDIEAIYDQIEVGTAVVVQP